MLRAPLPTLSLSSPHSNLHRATRSKPPTLRSRPKYTLKPYIPVSGYRNKPSSPPRPTPPIQLCPSYGSTVRSTSSCYSDNGQAAARDLPLSPPTPPNPNPPITASTHPSHVDGKLPSSPNDLQRSSQSRPSTYAPISVSSSRPLVCQPSNRIGPDQFPPAHSLRSSKLLIAALAKLPASSLVQFLFVSASSNFNALCPSTPDQQNDPLYRSPLLRYFLLLPQTQAHKLRASVPKWEKNGSGTRL